MKTGSLEYKVVNECKCGFEELFNIIGFVDYTRPSEIDRIVKAVVNLCNSGHLECKLGNKLKDQLSETDLKDHISKRVNNGEDLESYPNDGIEYCFFASKKAISMLEEEDKPI